MYLFGSQSLSWSSRCGDMEVCGQRTYDIGGSHHTQPQSMRRVEEKHALKCRVNLGLEHSSKFCHLYERNVIKDF